MAESVKHPRVSGDPHHTDIKSTSPLNVAGRMHTKLSRRHKRFKREAWSEQVLAATDARAARQAAIKVDKYTCQLAVRNAFGWVTGPMDRLLGNVRSRAGYRADPALPLKRLRSQQQALLRQQAKDHPSDAGALGLGVGYAAVGAASLAGLGGMMLGGAVGALGGPIAGGSVGSGAAWGGATGLTAGAGLGAVAVSVPGGIFLQMAALPSACLKAVADGIGAASGAIYAPLHAGKTAARLRHDGIKREPRVAPVVLPPTEPCDPPPPVQAGPADEAASDSASDTTDSDDA